MKQVSKKMLLSAAGLVLLLGLAATTVLGKYATETKQDGVVKADKMYFSSPLLPEKPALIRRDDEVMTHTLANWDKDKKLAIEISNFPDSQRVTSEDITYYFRVDDRFGAKLYADGAQQEDLLKGGIISEDIVIKGGEQTTQKFYLSFSELAVASEGTITVQATTKAPYSRTLGARFKIQKAASGFNVAVEDEPGSAFAKLIITTETKTPLSLLWQDGVVVPDQTNKFLKDVTIQTVEGGDSLDRQMDLGELDAISSATIYMFKYNEGADYDSQRPFEVKDTRQLGGTSE